MKIAIDASPYAVTEGTGVATYVRELVKALARIDAETEYILCTRISRLPRRGSFLPPPAQNFSEKIMVEGVHLVFARTIDLFHGTDARAARLDVPQVITIHDLFQEESPEYSSSKFKEKKQEYYDGSASRARAIIVPSRHVAQVFKERYPSVEYKIVVIPHGVGEEFTPQDASSVAAVREKYGLPEKYILFVGSIGKRKNALRLVDAFAKIAGDFSDTALVLAGKSSYGGDAVSLAVKTSAHRDRILMPGYVGAADLPALYSGAAVFALPSFSEGFGIPILEAFACGVAVLAGNRTSIPEVAGEAALLVNPFESDEIAEGLRTLLSDNKKRDEFVRLGRERVRGFTWEKSAIAHLELYREIVAESER